MTSHHTLQDFCLSFVSQHYSKTVGFSFPIELNPPPLEPSLSMCLRYYDYYPSAPALEPWGITGRFRNRSWGGGNVPEGHLSLMDCAVCAESTSSSE